MLDEVLNIKLATNSPSSDIVFDTGAETTDDELVRSVLDGNEEAFAVIFDRYRRPMARTVSRFFRDPAEIEEFVQQAFTKAYFSLKRYRGGQEYSFAGWMSRIAVNVCYDEFRKRQRRGESRFTEMSDEETDYIERIADGTPSTAEDAVIAGQLAEKVLAGLDPDDRIALTMMYCGEHSLDETANAIGITTSNLKTRLFRCRKLLKTRFGHLFF